MKYTYSFVTVPVTIGATKSTIPNYQQIITEHAEQGWHFVQLIIDNPAAILSEYVLVFERPIS